MITLIGAIIVHGFTARLTRESGLR
jgi:hypothetical protein